MTIQEYAAKVSKGMVTPVLPRTNDPQTARHQDEFDYDEYIDNADTSGYSNEREEGARGDY